MSAAALPLQMCPGLLSKILLEVADFLEGDATKHFSLKKKGFSVKRGEAIQWIRGLVRISTGKAIQWRAPGDSVNRRTLESEKKVAVLIPFPKIGSYFRGSSIGVKSSKGDGQRSTTNCRDIVIRLRTGRASNSTEAQKLKWHKSDSKVTPKRAHPRVTPTVTQKWLWNGVRSHFWVTFSVTLASACRNHFWVFLCFCRVRSTPTSQWQDVLW